MIVLQESGDEEVLETARFCGMMNDFFDCTNVRSLTESVRKKNQLVVIEPHLADFIMSLNLAEFIMA